MEMTGEHDKRLEQYDDFVTGPDPIQKLDFVDDEHYYATSSNEVKHLCIKFSSISTTLSTRISPLIDPRN